MTIHYAITQERKKLATAVASSLGTKYTYAGAPTLAYIVGEYTISREGTLSGPDNRDLVEALVQKGFEPTLAQYDIDINAEASAPEAPEPEQLDRLTIEMPMEGFDPAKLDNLSKLVDSKEVLLKMALGVDALPIQILEDRIAFPWFPCDGNATAYAQLITAICHVAKEKTRVIARPNQEYPNPRFTMRCWLTTTLGLVGEDYRKIRKLLCAPLEGNSAWSQGHDPRKAAKTEATAAAEPADSDEEGNANNE